jgi:mono/diheme cytochrome c family protein
MARTLVGICTLVLLSAWTAASQSTRSVWEGVYTEAQAKRGETVFGGTCARCHMSEDFAGSTFIGGWENSTVLDLFRLTQRTMPMDSPGSLRPEEYADVVAYFFSLNKFPAGDTELGTDAERLQVIRIESKK